MVSRRQKQKRTPRGRHAPKSESALVIGVRLSEKKHVQKSYLGSGDNIILVFSKNPTEKVTIEISQKSPAGRSHKIILVTKKIESKSKKRIKYKIDDDNSKISLAGQESEEKLTKYVPSPNQTFPYIRFYLRIDKPGSKKLTIIKKDPILIPIDIGEMRATNDICEQIIDIDVKINAMEKEHLFTYKFIYRRMSLKKKFEKFLEWQSSVIYGPPKGGFNSETLQYEPSPGWGKNRLGTVLNVSATGANDVCINCSPLVALFLAYWFNYNQYYTFRTGSSSKAIAGKTKNILIDQNNEKLFVNGYGAFLDELINNENKKNGKWWRTKFWDEHLEKAEPGDIFICSSGSHVWMLVKFGSNFTFPKRFIFNEKATGNCEPGIYMIQAGTTGPKGVNFKKYPKNDIGKLVALINKWKNINKKTPNGKTKSEIAGILSKAKKQMDNDPKIRAIFVQSGSSLLWQNSMIKKKGDKIISIVNIDAANTEYTAQKLYNKENASGDFYAPFQAWKIKADILDSETGLIRKDKKKNLPTEFWLRGKAVTNVDLTLNDCRPIVNFGKAASIAGATTITKDLKVVLGVEVDPTAGAKTEAEFALGTPGGEHDTFAGFKAKQVFDKSTLKKEEKEKKFNLEIDIDAIKDVAIRVRPSKNWLLKSYDEDTGATTFRESTYPTSELLAELYIFKGDKCLNGNKTVDQVVEEMKKTKPGINKILVRVDESVSKIQDLIIDGIVHIKDGDKKI